MRKTSGGTVRSAGKEGKVRRERRELGIGRKHGNRVWRYPLIRNRGTGVIGGV